MERCLPSGPPNAPPRAPSSSSHGRAPDGRSAFIDLRANPRDFDAVAEAEQHPPLMQALRALNATRSPVFTAKCDAWPLNSEELQHLQLNLNAHPAGPSFGFASYIDLIWRERSLFHSFHRQEQMLRRLTRLAAPAPVAGPRWTACCGPRCLTWTARARASPSAFTSRRSAPVRSLRGRSGPLRWPPSSRSSAARTSPAEGGILSY